MRRIGLVLPLGALIYMSGGTVTAQVVTGGVVDERTGSPLVGVLVSLLRAADNEARVAASLSDASGRFTLRVPAVGRYRLRAERIGLGTVTSEPFDIGPAGLSGRRLAMGDEPITLAGLVVDSRVASCRVDPVDGPRIQRWWSEARKALEVSALVQRERMARFRIQRFQRDWSADLRSLISEQNRYDVGFFSRPFASLDATGLAEGGFVQGSPGERSYYAPDADVLLSDTFLADHCFRVVEDSGRPGSIGLGFEPTRGRRMPDVSGTLWVDTASAELRSLSFRYTGLVWLPANEAGGAVSFRYLPSGAWIVDEWHIRMPRQAVAADGGTEGGPVVGYRDVGGRVSALSIVSLGADRAGSASVSGVVYDSVAGAPLADARVVVVGTRVAALTDLNGAYLLSGVPAGTRSITFFHQRLSRWGLGTRVVEVRLQDGERRSVPLAVPGFRQVAFALCGPAGEDAEAVLSGRVVDSTGEVVAGGRVVVTWERLERFDLTREGRAELTTGSDGRFRFCGAPAGAPLVLRARIGGQWVEVPAGALSYGAVEYHEIIPRG